MRDVVFIAFVFFGMPLLFVAVASWVLHYVVALSSPPARRAAWTAGMAYVLVAVASVFMTRMESWWIAPLAPIPAALLAFWFWRNDFRRDWIDEAEDAPDGVELATDDWRIGLLQLGAFIMVVLAAVTIRFFYLNV